MKKYVVYVDDNFHYMDKSSRYKLSEFETYEEAVRACKKIIDEYFEKLEKKGFKDLWESYTMFGKDPYIIPDDECKFSAWKYAKQRCKELASEER